MSVGLERFLSIETLGGARFLPTKDTTTNREGAPLGVYLSDASGSAQLYLGELRDRTLVPLRCLTDGSEDRCTSPLATGDGGCVFLTDRGGDERFRMGTVDPHQDRPATVLPWSDCGAKHLPLGASPAHVYFAANTPHPRVFSISRASLPLAAASPPQLLWTPPEALGKACGLLPNPHNPDQLLVELKSSHLHSRLFLSSLPPSSSPTSDVVALQLSPELPPASSPLPGSHCRPVCFLDSNHVLVITTHASDMARLAVLALDRPGELLPCSGLEALEGVELEEAIAVPKQSHDEHASAGRAVYFSAAVDGYSQLYRGQFTAAGARGVEKLGLPDGAVLVSADERQHSHQFDISQ